MTPADADRRAPNFLKEAKLLGGLRLERLRQSSGAMVAYATVALLFLELMLYGGDQPIVSLGFAAVELLLLAGFLIFAAWVRRALKGVRQLDAAALLFLGVLLWTGLQIAPLGLPRFPEGWAIAPGQTTVSLAPDRTLTELLELAGLGAVFVLALAIGRDDDRAHAAWNALGVLFGLYLVWSILSYAGVIGPTVIGAKLQASLGNANTAATVCAMAVAVSWTAILRAVMSLHGEALTAHILTRLLLRGAPWVVLLLLGFAALSLTGSRGGAGACLAGLLTTTAVMAWSEQKRRRTLLFIAGAGVALLVLFGFLVLSSGAVASRLALTDAALANRRTIIGIYLEQLTELPWTGFGLGTFRHFNNLLAGPGDHAVLWDLGALHNVFLQWIFESGYPGAVLMFGTLLLIVGSIARGLTRRRFGRTWIAGSLGVTAVVLSHGLVDFALQLPAIAGLWAFALGAGLGVSRLGGR